MAKTDSTVEYLYKGIINFFPDVAQNVFGIPKGTYGTQTPFMGAGQPEFTKFLFDETGAHSDEEAAKLVLDWKTGKVERNTPGKERLDEMIAAMEEADKRKASAYEKARLANEAFLESQRVQERKVVAPESPAPAARLAEKPAVDMVEFRISAGLANTLTSATGKVLRVAGEVATTITGTKSLAQSKNAREFQGTFSTSELRRMIAKLEGEGYEARRQKLYAFADSVDAAQYSYYKQSRLTTEYASIEQIVIGSGKFTMGEITSLKTFVLSSAQGAVGGVIKKGLTKAITTALVSSGAIEAATGVGIPLAVVQVAVAKFVDWAENKLKELPVLIKKYARYVVVLGAGIFLISASIGNLFGMVFGGSTFLLGAANAGLGGGMAVFSKAIQGFFAGLIVPSLAVPLISILIGFPLVVALILFIINSGAYLVPPSSLSQSGENPYINVVKEASPTGPFENSDVPLTVSYTITVTAKRGALSNLKFEHKCESLQKGARSACPSPLPGEIPQQISPDAPYVFTYTETYSGAPYRNALVLNTFTVTADSPETTNETASGASSIIIGNPPTGCFKVKGAWPSTESQNISSAIINLVGSAAPFVSKLCAAWPEVNLYYDPPKVCGVWGCAPGGNTIYFNSGGTRNVSNATYILAHEAGHVLAYGMPSLYQAYLSFPGTLSELPVCTYGGSSSAEGFAEAIARFATNASCLNSEVNNKKFVETKIFR